MVSAVLQILQSTKVGMVVTQTSLRVVGIITDKVHPILYFQATVSMQKNVGICLVCYIIPTTLVCVLFGTTIPTLSFFILVSVFFYLPGQLLRGVISR